MSTLDWNDLRFLLAVADAGSTIAAARRLRLNQTTVARRLDALERALGVPLFERRTCGYVLTARGRDAVALARSVEQAALALEAAARSWQRETSGVLRVTTTELLASEIVAPLVAELAARMPGLSIELLTDDRRLDIRTGEADVVIRLGTPESEPDLVGRRVGESRWALYCSKEYADRCGLPDRPEALRRHRVIGGSGALQTTPALRWAQDLAGEAVIALRCNTVANLLAAVEAGNGIGPLPCFVAQHRRTLRRCLADRDTAAPIWLLYRAAQRHAPHLRLFVDALAARFATLRPQFQGAVGQATLPISAAGPAAAGNPT